MLANPGTSRAVLIGVSTFSHFEQLPAVKRDVADMAEVLRDRRIWGLAPEHCQTIGEPFQGSVVLDKVEEAAHAATGTLLIYYAGHGMTVGADGLCLALTNSRLSRLDTALRYDDLRSLLAHPKAKARSTVVILDCCWAGRAIGGMTAGETLASLAAVRGVCVLAAAAATKQAQAPPGEAYTAFTGALLGAMHDGLPGEGEFLSVEALYRNSYTLLAARGMPLPELGSRGLAGQIFLGRNLRYSRPTVDGADDPADNPRFKGKNAGAEDQPAFTDASAIGGPLGIVRLLTDKTEGARNSGGINAVDFSPDGTLLAAGGGDKAVRIWETASGELVRTLTGHTGLKGWNGSVLAVAFSPDGALLASGGEDKTVRIWEVSTGEPVRVITKCAGGVGAVTFSPDGTLLATGEGYRNVRIREAASGNVIRAFTGRYSLDLWNATVCRVVFSPDGKLFAIAWGYQPVEICEVATGKTIQILNGHNGWVRCVAFSPDGDALAVGDPRAVRLWHPVEGTLVHEVTGDGISFDVLAFSPDGSLLLTAGSDEKVRIWEVATGALVRTLVGNFGSVRDMTFNSDGSLLATSGRDQVVRLWG
jgi:hypothetical protein